MSKLRLEAIRQEVFNAVKSFENKYLRLSQVEDERLEFQVNQRWVPKKNEEISNKKQQQRHSGFHSLNPCEQVNFYGVSLLFFSEISNQPALDLQIMDTMFFLPDHSICYLYKDLKKGLTKLKQRGITACETFIKRNSKKKEALFREKPYSKSKSTILISQEKSEKSLTANLDYFALLKYKDSSFIRLKQSDVRSIFTNPLYANERFRHNNCTQYIQILPSENSQEMRIQYSLQKFKDDPLMQAAKNMQLGKIGPFGDRTSLRKMLQEINPTIYLYFTVFELVSFVAIHYNKQVKSGNFHFVCQDDTWCLADAENVKLITFKQREFRRYELWATQLPTESQLRIKQTGIFQEKPEEKTLFAKTVENYFTQTNENIKKGIVDFIKNQVEKIKKPEDQQLSKTIFEILHPGEGTRFYQYLNSPYEMTRPIKPKKQNKGQSGVKRKPESCQSLKMLPKRTIREQMLRRQQQKKEYIYRGLEG